ncbi:MAG TPA: MaoC/PaaZ C-terminal domain-containing protein [Polyangiaceae bacterium]
MKVDPSTVGYQTKPFTFEYDFRTTILYALGVGATQDELDYLYEGRGPKVLPSFAVVPSYAPATELFAHTGCALEMVLHGGQTIRVHRPIPPAGKLSTIGIVKGIYDMKRFAQVVLETHTSENGEPLFVTEWQVLVRESGGFGGPRPPKAETHSAPREASPSFALSLPTSPEQALLYRLSGDLNPLHADPETAQRVGFERGPILHGLCTFGVVTRALLRHLGSGASVRALSAQFRKPVWPGEPIRTEGYDLGDGYFALEAFAADRPDPVITSGWAQVAR